MVHTLPLSNREVELRYNGFCNNATIAGPFNPKPIKGRVTKNAFWGSSLFTPTMILAVHYGKES